MATAALNGKPAIPRPADASPGVGQAIDNIRARFVAIEGIVNTLSAGASVAADSVATQLARLRNELVRLDRLIAVLQQADGSAATTRTLVAAADVAAGAPVWISDTNLVSPLDPDDPLACSGFLGITAAAAGAGSEVEIRLPGGTVEYPDAAFAPGLPVYAVAGGVTQAPAGNSLPVGVAYSSTVIAVAAGTTALAALGFDPANEDWMPASVGLVREALDNVGVYMPMTNGEIPPALLYSPDGELIYTRVA